MSDQAERMRRSVKKGPGAKRQSGVNASTSASRPAAGKPFMEAGKPFPHRMSFDMTEEMYELLDDAKPRGVSKVAIVRELVRRGLDDPNLGDILAGLAEEEKARRSRK